MSDQLTYTHYKILLPLKDDNKIDYYIKISVENNLRVREISSKIKGKEYEWLDDHTKQKLINKEETKIEDLIKNPIVIKKDKNYEVISEKMLQKLILEDISSFLEELGNSFTFIKNEYKIKIGDSFNYIDLFLFNIEFNCYVVVELKITSLKKEHIG